MSSAELILPEHVDLHMQKVDDLQPGQVIADGRYEIIDALAPGGQHRVYKAEDKLSAGRVAIKLFDEPNEQMRLSVDRELTANIMLSGNRGINETLDMGITTDTNLPQRYFTSKLADTDASGLKEEYKDIPMHILVEGALEVVYGIEVIKRAGLAHKDIKPRNILVDKSNNQWSLTDFGSVEVIEAKSIKIAPELGALAVSDTAPTNPMLVSTIGFLAPELVDGVIDTKTDVFSLGATIYRLATGELPYKGNNLKAYIDSVNNFDPKPINTLNEDVPEELNDIVQGCLKLQPKERPSIETLASSLESVDI